MNPTSLVLRWYRQTTSGSVLQRPYTAEEVLQLLRSHADANSNAHNHQPHAEASSLAARSEAVREVASQPITWLGKLTQQQRLEIGELADRLPSLLFHYTTGGDTAELRRRFGGWSTWRYERALELAGMCIASRLNHA